MAKWTTALRILTQGKELKQEGKDHGITKVLKKMEKKKTLTYTQSRRSH